MNPISNNLDKLGSLPQIPSSVGNIGSPAQPTGPSFTEMLDRSIGEVARLQKEAGTAVQQVVTGQTDDLPGVMLAMEKSEMAFKTLIAIRGKLLDAYEEIRNMPI